ncbi:MULTISPECIES: ABC transporter permease subunit [unclassified Corallococcus]|uniref:ABC transporter permease subunit n=1 Tax=unclassified Corallococcus TaxID=2685029 RepID=UPI001A8F0685|nr:MULTISPECIES: ABC transporter permease subunit [unclassified Corallococcus]MBN9683345.1 ABC transporter permease [Corallococcus sp. NCSPR001]WAS89513.1 ABC transporter permease subunit [Corallococcus sp. NCRR]
MAFRPRRALAVFWKDSLDLRKNVGLLVSMAVLPLVMVTVPIGVVWTYVRQPDQSDLRMVALFYDPTLPLGASAARFLIDKSLTDWFGMFLVMPVFIPILIASQSVAGEKERRTLEPLLASPVSAAELVAGKCLAALVPAVVLTWVAFALFCVGVDWVAWPLVGAPLMPNALWGFGVFVLAPLFAFFGNGVAVLISARVSEARMAQQLSALVVLPLVGLVGGQVAGVLKAGMGYYAIQGGVVVVLDVILLAASIRFLDRERLVSRWG